MNIVIRNIAEDVDDDALLRIMRVFGEVVSTRVLRNPRNGKSRRIGFVKFTTEQAARDAKETLNGKKVYPSQLGESLRYSVEFSVHSGDVLRSRMLHVRNIPQDSPVAAHALFARLGRIRSARMRRQKPYGASMYMCEVEYETVEEAERVMREIHNSHILSDHIPLMAKFSEQPESRTERKVRREMARNHQHEQPQATPQPLVVMVPIECVYYYYPPHSVLQ